MSYTLHEPDFRFQIPDSKTKKDVATHIRFQIPDSKTEKDLATRVSNSRFQIPEQKNPGHTNQIPDSRFQNI